MSYNMVINYLVSSCALLFSCWGNGLAQRCDFAEVGTVSNVIEALVPRYIDTMSRIPFLYITNVMSGAYIIFYGPIASG